MIYKFDKETLTFKSVTSNIVVILLSTILVLTSVIGYVMITKVNQIKYITQETKLAIIRENNQFSEEKLIEYMKEIHMRFPHIVLAQARIESGHYSSAVFKQNNNIFGMKLATQRVRYSIGEKLNHAVYTTWRRSVDDYAVRQAVEYTGISNEAEYFECLRQYAEDPSYVVKIKEMADKCKILFED
jgi:uncharacterized FlgJ-related protein